MLMKKHNLIVSQETKLKAKRVSERPKPRAERPNEIYGIDMTKIKLETEGWVYLVVVIDWYTKKIVGHTLDDRSKSSHWLSALNQAVCLQCPEGTRGKGIKLVSDNGCQPTSIAFMKATGLMGSSRYLPAITIRREMLIQNESLERSKKNSSGRGNIKTFASLKKPSKSGSGNTTLNICTRH